MRKQFFFFLLLCIPFLAKADHITGGQMYYTFMGTSNGMYDYKVTLMLYMRCNSGREFPNPGYVSVFDKGTRERRADILVALGNQQTIQVTESNPCITNPPRVCYEVGYYVFTVSLPSSEFGYILSSQVNFRIAGISNLYSGYSQIGATYTTEIPGTSSGDNTIQNNSAQFTGSDLVVVCANNSFSYSFAAKDADGDQLRYGFCNAYVAGGGGRGAEGAPSSAPPFPPVPYGQGFSGAEPLTKSVSIDPNTGLIKGIAPDEGIYVVTVCVDEIRNGVVIATQRKDLQINIADCKIAAASLLPDYTLCADTKTINISNQSTSPLITSYNWQFYDNKGATIYSSTTPSVTYSFPDTGMYSISLVINRNGPCSDSIISRARVYPGFKPSFDFAGICITKPTVFKDATTSVYGTVNSWDWDFGESSNDGFSDDSDPTYTYKTQGVKNVVLTVTDDKGCRDTYVKPITIVDKPPIKLAFRDALICINDDIQLQATGSGIFSWTPAVNIINSNSANPVVSPATTTTYFVHLDDDGCLNDDSVKVRVVDHVTLSAMNDTTICSSDTIRLNLLSDGLKYTWTPASQLNDSSLQYPTAITNNTTTYEVKAEIGSCSATDRITVATVPYPTANIGDDKLICYNASVQLNASTDGSSFQWSPPESLDNASVLNPIATPPGTTPYVFYAFDTKGCPKPGIDTILVTVLPVIEAFAGRDTAVVMNQPLQLNATGGTTYSWIPGTGLSAYDINNPVAVYTTPSTGIRYKVYISNEAGCTDSAFVTVKVFSTKPSVFVPTAFTPNSDGKNDKLRPVAAGIKNIEYFKVFNRWGQLVFSTNANGQGWDGNISGQPQGTGTFVWMVKAVDYLGLPYFEKGITTLIR